MLGGRALPPVIRQLVSDHVCRLSLLKKLSRTRGLERAARMHGYSRGAAPDTLGEHFRVVSLVLARQQRAEILDTFAVCRISRLEASPAHVASCGELDTVRGETILDQRYAHTLGCLVIFENGENHSAHVALLAVGYRE
jgi:hypothetical protein